VPTAFVFSGGGSLGAVQVGMLLALADHGVAPDLLAGTSVGALNAAWTAASPGADGARALAEIWSRLRRRDIFPASPLRLAAAVSGRRDHLVSAAGLRNVIEAHLPFRLLEDAPVPLTVIATELMTGIEVALERGPAVPAILASAAIPGVFPPVVVGGHTLVDGGVANHTPLSHAVAAGADIVYVLPTGYACALARPPRSALGVAMHAVTLLMQQRLTVDVAHCQATVDVRLLPPLCPLAVAPTDFGHTRELVERARASSAAWLAKGDHTGDQTRFLGLHRH
jgi:NTE family protein